MATRFRIRWTEVGVCILVCAASAGVGMAFVDAVTERAADRIPVRESTLPACATEDDPGPCAWDATRQGNGVGRSFVVIEDRTYYLPEHR